ncbi:MAG: diadenylate cyclase CdaA [bacterium]|nr:diadenylate cyclase CdaA [bacterium]
MINFFPLAIRFLDILEILLIACIFYWLFILIRETRAVQGLKVLAFLIIASFGAHLLQLYTIDWILQSLWTILPLAFVILFQPELRRVIGEIDKNYILRKFFKQESRLITEIVRVMMALSKEGSGALIVLKQNISLKNYIETGVRINAEVSYELLKTMFTPDSLLHDGAVIIQGDKIIAASCVLPLTQNPEVTIPLGTRHRAALGLSEETDALVLVVSEETGGISITLDGKMRSDLDEESLTEMLTLYKAKETEGFTEESD